MKLKGRSYSMALAECTGDGPCLVHIILYNEKGDSYADAPMTMRMARKFGSALVRIGEGDDPHDVIREMSEELPNA